MFNLYVFYFIILHGRRVKNMKGLFISYYLNHILILNHRFVFFRAQRNSGFPVLCLPPRVKIKDRMNKFVLN